jgi:hypothetical protein
MYLYLGPQRFKSRACGQVRGAEVTDEHLMKLIDTKRFKDLCENLQPFVAALKEHYGLDKLKKEHVIKWAKVASNLYKRIGSILVDEKAKDIQKAKKNLEANWRIFFKENYQNVPEAYIEEVRDFEVWPFLAAKSARVLLIQHACVTDPTRVCY